jgi:hypothetical protein
MVCGVLARIGADPKVQPEHVPSDAGDSMTLLEPASYAIAAARSRLNERASRNRDDRAIVVKRIRGPSLRFGNSFRDEYL